MSVVALPEIRPTVAELLDKLQALGSHRAIALHLTETGIQGTPCNAGSCAIALYLQQETGEDVNIGDDDLVIWRGALPDEYHDIPPAVRDFIAFFDKRFYPDLIHPSAARP